MYSMILPVANAKVFVDQIFRIFDKDGNGDIDFKVFMTTHMIQGVPHGYVATKVNECCDYVFLSQTLFPSNVYT